MSVFYSALEDVEAADIERLIAEGRQEGRNLEFKRDMYGDTESQRKEFLKDVSAFANSFGGQLIIGIAADDGEAAEIVPVPGNSDEQILRLENMVRAGIEPRIIGIRMHPVQIRQNEFVYVVQVPQSWNPPHRVSFRNSNRFHLRSSAGIHEASVEELRSLFTKGAEMRERMAAFINGRLQQIRNGNALVPIGSPAEGRRGLTLLHILPLVAFVGDSQIDVEAAERISNNFMPIGRTGGSPRINFDGFIFVRPGEQPHGYTQLFRNGIVEAVKTPVVGQIPDAESVIPAARLIRDLYQSIPAYVRGLQTLEVPPPFFISISLLDVSGAYLSVNDGPWYFDGQTPIDRDVLQLPLQTISDYGADADYKGVLTPAFNALWNAVGLGSAERFISNIQ